MCVYTQQIDISQSSRYGLRVHDIFFCPYLYIYAYRCIHIHGRVRETRSRCSRWWHACRQRGKTKTHLEYIFMLVACQLSTLCCSVPLIRFRAKSTLTHTPSKCLHSHTNSHITDTHTDGSSCCWSVMRSTRWFSDWIAACFIICPPNQIVPNRTKACWISKIAIRRYSLAFPLLWFNISISRGAKFHWQIRTTDNCPLFDTIGWSVFFIIAQHDNSMHSWKF